MLTKPLIHIILTLTTLLNQIICAPETIKDAGIIPVMPSEYPFMVTIVDKNEYAGQGILVSTGHVLASNIHFIMRDLSSFELHFHPYKIDPNSNNTKVNVRKIKDGVVKTYDNYQPDPVILLELDEPIENIPTIKLSEEGTSYPEANFLQAVGWGLDENEQPYTLKQTKVSVLRSDRLKELGPIEEYEDKKFIIADMSKNKFCKKIYGSILIDYNNEIPEAVGIDINNSECDDSDYDQIYPYVNLKYYSSWVNQKTSFDYDKV